MDAITRHKLTTAIGRWDARQGAADRRAGRVANPYRVGIALGALDRASERMVQGATLRQALLVSFNDRLLSAVLKAVGEPDFTEAERREADRASYHAIMP